METPVKENKDNKVGLGNFKVPTEAAAPAAPPADAIPPVDDDPIEPVKGAPIDTPEPEKKKEPALKKKAEVKKKEEVIPEKVELSEAEMKYLESLDEPTDDVDAPVEDTPPAEKKVEGKKKAATSRYDAAKIESAMQKAELYDRISTSPAISFVEEFIKSGKASFEEYISTYMPPDPKKMSPEDLFKMSLTEFELTDEEREEEIDGFNSKSKLQQQQLIKPIKDRLQQQREEKLRAVSAAPAIDPAAHQKMVDEGFKSLDAQLHELSGSIKDGLIITDDVAALIREDVIENAILRKDGSGFDIDKSIRNAIRQNDKIDLIRQRDIRNLAKKSAYDLLIKQRNRPARNDSSTGAIPPLPEDRKAVLNEIKKERWKD